MFFYKITSYIRKFMSSKGERVARPLHPLHPWVFFLTWKKKNCFDCTHVKDVKIMDVLQNVIKCALSIYWVANQSWLFLSPQEQNKTSGWTIVLLMENTYWLLQLCIVLQFVKLIRQTPLAIKQWRMWSSCLDSS